jgi:hypothetical protein
MAPARSAGEMNCKDLSLPDMVVRVDGDKALVLEVKVADVIKVGDWLDFVRLARIAETKSVMLEGLRDEWRPP